jgi:tRNA(Arg) A34 adenosine deaminase TadA
MAKNMEKKDENFLRAAIVVARNARQNGNHPFGAILVDMKDRIILEAENSVVVTGDCTGHAEINLVRQASMSYDKEYLAQCTLYASTEPCPMCTAAIFWSNIRRLVYGLSEERLYELVGEDSNEVLALPTRDVLSRGKKSIDVTGPMLEDEAIKVHINYWD